jgi:hypothetical protein
VLKAAGHEHARVNKFFPKPAEILALADPELARRRCDQRRIEKLIGHNGKGPTPKPAFEPAPVEHRLTRSDMERMATPLHLHRSYPLAERM